MSRSHFHPRCSFFVLFFIAIFLLLSSLSVGAQAMPKACNSSLGIENKNIPDNNFKASSYSPSLYIGKGKSQDMKAKYSRLNNQYAWCTNKRRKVKSWLMVDLGRKTILTAIATQGYVGVGDYYVTSFMLAYSIDETMWKFVLENGKHKVFTGNRHGLDIKTNVFSQIQARYVKVYPVTYSIRICLRIELYGCVEGASPTIVPSTSRIILNTSAITTTANIKVTAFTSINLTPSASVNPTVSASINPTASTISPLITANLLPTFNTPRVIGSILSSLGNLSTVASSQSILPTSSYVPRGLQSSIMTTNQPSQEVSTSLSTFIKALREGSSVAKDRRKFFIIGFGIFAALLFMVILTFLVFLLFKKRRKEFNLGCQLVVLPEYPYQSHDDCDPVGFSFAASDNQIT